MNSSPENLAKRYQIGDLLLDSGSRSVKRGNDELRLGALTFDLLQALAEAAPNMASYDYLADKV